MTSDIVGSAIVAGVDGSTSALHAACWAAAVAGRRNLPLRLVHAVNVPALAYSAAMGSPTGFFDDLEAAGRQRLGEAEAAVRRAHPELDIIQDLHSGADPVPALLELSAAARLVVLGSRGLGGFTGILAGSTAVAVAARGDCPVAVVRGADPQAAPPTAGPVVVGVDGSPASEAAVAWAYEEASLRGADLVAVHAWADFANDLAYLRARQAVVDWTRLETEQRELLAERLAGWSEKYPDVVVRRVVARDRPTRCLLDQAVGAQLLVVGSRGRGGFAGMLLGSTSQAMIYHAPCPVLVARPGAGH